MDKLERYLDQICHAIGGPLTLRQHVRQELREHLLDAMAQHQARGLSDEDMLERVLEEFGKPEDIRSELEATHGHRMMAVVIDKAMQWKELTMRAKWLWTTWAYLSLAVVIVLEVVLIAFAGNFVVPHSVKLIRDGLISSAILEQTCTTWIPSFLYSVSILVGNYTALWVVLAAVAWGLFEWRIRSENKPFMRLSALGTVAVGLMAVVCLTVGSLLTLICLVGR